MAKDVREIFKVTARYGIEFLSTNHMKSQMREECFKFIKRIGMFHHDMRFILMGLDLEKYDQ